MQKPKIGDQFSFSADGDGFTSIMALVGKEVKVLNPQGQTSYVALSSLQLHSSQGAVAYWILKESKPNLAKGGKPLPEWTATVAWHGQSFKYDHVHGKTERAAVAAACAILATQIGLKPANVTSTVWNKGWYEVQRK